MVQVFDLTPTQSTASMIGNALGTGLGVRFQRGEMQNQQSQLSKALFGDEAEKYANIPMQGQLKIAELRQKEQLNNASLIQDAQKQQDKILSDQNKAKEKVIPIIGGINTLNRMRQLRKQGNLGRLSPLYKQAGGQTAKDYGEYGQLGKSLISLSTNIPIRNRVEFEVLAEKLYDPSISDKEAEGVLNAMESVLKNSLSSYSDSFPDQNENDNSQPTTRPPLTSFNR